MFTVECQFTMWLLVFVLLQTAELGAHFQSVEALSRGLVQSTVGQNCSRYNFLSDGFEHGGKSTTKLFTDHDGSEQRVGLMCPPWFTRNGDGGCTIEENIDSGILGTADIPTLVAKFLPHDDIECNFHESNRFDWKMHFISSFPDRPHSLLLPTAL